MNTDQTLAALRALGHESRLAAFRQLVQAGDSGMAAGVSSTMRYLGGIVGIALLGRVIDGAGSVEAVLDQHNLLLSIFVGVLAATIACAALLGRRPAPYS